MGKRFKPFIQLTLTILILASITVFQQLNSVAEDPQFSTIDTEAILDHLLGMEPLIEPPDANEDGRIDVADLVLTVNHNPPAEREELPPSVDLVLAARSLPPGGLLELSWQVTGLEDPSGYELQLRATAPGQVTAATLDTRPGMVPANGNVLYLTSGADRGLDCDVWTTSPAAFSAQALTTEQSARARIYEDMPGEWLFEARLLRDGEPVAFDRERLYASDRPTIRLRVNRRIANSGDTVRAELATVGGDLSTPVRLSAWLDTPEGGGLGLPNLEPGGEPLWTGPARENSLLLFDQPLGEWGLGRFAVHAMLAEADTGKVLALAEAPVRLDDTPSTITGQVLNQYSRPINGPSFLLAQVRAVEIHDGHSVVAAVDATGEYTLALMPGEYLLSALVLASTPLKPHETFAGPFDLTGDAGLVKRLTLSTLSYTQESAGVEGFREFPALKGLSHSASSGQPPTPKAYVTFEFSGSTTGTSELAAVAQTYVEALRSNMPGVRFQTQSDVVELLNAGRVEEAAEAIACQYVVPIRVHDFGLDAGASRYVFTSKVLNARNALALDRSFESAETAANLRQAVVQRAEASAPVLEQAMIRSVPYPVRPTIRVDLLNDSFWPGRLLDVRVTLTEADGTPVDGKTLSVQHWKGPVFDTKLAEVSGVTGTAGPGCFETQFCVPTDVLEGSEGQQCEVRAIYRREQEEWEKRRRYPILPVGSGPGLRLYIPFRNVYWAKWHPGDYFLVWFSMKDDQGAPVAGAPVESFCINCSASPSVATTDARGIAEFTVTPGSRNGYAAINVSCQPAGDPFIHHAKYPFTVIGGVSVFIERADKGASSLQTLQSVLPSPEGMIPIYVDVYKGDDKIPAVPVTLTLSGEGSLLGAQTQTDPVGTARALFVPPSLQRGRSTLRAVTRFGTEVGEATLDIDYDPGLILLASVPDYLDENGEGRVEVRVGRPQDSGPPIWEEGAQIEVVATGGTVTPAAGTSDAAGRFTGYIQAEAESPKVDLVVQALSTQDLSTAEKTLAAHREGKARIRVVVDGHSYREPPLPDHQDIEIVDGLVMASASCEGKTAVEGSTAALEGSYGSVHLSARAYNNTEDIDYSEQVFYGQASCYRFDHITINDPALTGEHGTARAMLYHSHQGLAKGNWQTEWFEVFGTTVARAVLSNDLRIDSRSSGFYLLWSYTAAKGETCHFLLKKPNEYVLEEPFSPYLFPFEFTYGMPFDFHMTFYGLVEAGVRYPGPYFPEIIEALADVQGDAFVVIVPDNPDAEVISDSGTDYR